MPPFEVMSSSSSIFDGDEVFLTLLHSQRELLNRLNMESAMRRANPPPTNTVPVRYAEGSKEESIIGGAGDPISLMSAPKTERRGSLDMFFSRRLSTNMGSMGHDNFGWPYADEMSEGTGSKIKGFEFLDTRKMKRRRSSLGLLQNAMNFGDQQQAQQRRLSLLSNFSGSFDFDDVFGQEDLMTTEKPTTKPTKEPASKPETSRLDPNMPAEVIRKTLQAFALATGESAKSQQDIHDWDRKMGLKRSHCKTMRMTTRSRKKLRTLFKKDINALSHHSNK